MPKIIDQMNQLPYLDKKGIRYPYGEFFPVELSMFAYNETIAQDYLPLTKEKAEARGYSWQKNDAKDYQISISTDNLPDEIDDVKDDILKEIIECAHQGKCNEECATAFRIIPQELEFYRKLGLPLPRLCFNCRHIQRIKKRNPMKLWPRTCECDGLASRQSLIAYTNTAEHFHGSAPCPNQFETSYAPDRPEIVYCESCYNSEVS